MTRICLSQTDMSNTIDTTEYFMLFIVTLTNNKVLIILNKFFTVSDLVDLFIIAALVTYLL